MHPYKHVCDKGSWINRFILTSTSTQCIAEIPTVRKDLLKFLKKVQDGNGSKVKGCFENHTVYKDQQIPSPLHPIELRCLPFRVSESTSTKNTFETRCSDKIQVDGGTFVSLFGAICSATKPWLFNQCSLEVEHITCRHFISIYFSCFFDILFSISFSLTVGSVADNTFNITA